jgi:surface protein
MGGMFLKSKFTGDISGWNTSKVTNMINMFKHSIFNGDISKWDIRNVEYMKYMFYCSKFSGNIDNWIPAKLRTDDRENFTIFL